VVALTAGDEEPATGGKTSVRRWRFYSTFCFRARKKRTPWQESESSSSEVLQINSHDVGHLLRSAVSVYFAAAAERGAK
jgi:hypothetical protein